MNAAKDWMSRRFGEETGSQTLISLLIPFGAYVLAEHLEASGILAVVAAGIVMSYEERSGRAMAVRRIRRAAAWDAIQFAGNGIIFVLLGQQLPGIVAGAGHAIGETRRQDEIWLLVYILAISSALTALRAIWACATLGQILFRAEGRRKALPMPGWRLIATVSLAGVRRADAVRRDDTSAGFAGRLSLSGARPRGSPGSRRNNRVVNCGQCRAAPS